MNVFAVAPIKARTEAARWADEELATLWTRGLLRHLEPLASPQGPCVEVGGKWFVNFSSNDYLSLANAPTVVAAAKAALDQFGVGSGASRLVVGDTESHRSLEKRLAGFLRSETALVFNGGYAANVGALSALCGPDDVIFSDALNHASIIDGCRLSRAQVCVYPHRDMGQLEALLASTPGRRRLVVTESVFSMDGNQAPLAELVEICGEHGAALMVDEAHAIGVLGPRGAGLCEELGLSDRVDLRVGTLGKSLGSFGAFVATSRPVRDLLIHHARSFVFSTALPASVCAAAEAAIELVEERALRAQLRWNMRRFAEGLQRLGLRASAESPIFPIVLGTPERAVEAAKGLRDRGILAKAIRPPTVPPGTSRLRLTVTAGHDDEHLASALRALEEVLK